MDQVVVDSSTAVKWFVDEPHKEIARLILSQYRSGVLELLAPEFIHAEFGNIIWKKRLFQGLDAADAQVSIEAFGAVVFQLTTAGSLLPEAYRLAVTHRRSLYDMLYLALSLRERCHFVTADERLVNAISQDFPNLVWLPNWS